MIISGSLGQRCLPLVEEIAQLSSIYVFCRQKTHHEEWAKRHRKVKGVFTQVEHICNTLRRDVHQSESTLTPISVVNNSSNNLDELDQSFMYSQLLKETLLEIEYDKKAKKELVDFCLEQYADNNNELKIINEFYESYNPGRAIYWYTRECFTYSMLNKALRTQDLAVIIKMGFFIQDLHRQITQLHSKSDKRYSMSVYRGQGMLNAEFEKVKESQGGLLSFNNFLSTSMERETSLGFARRALENAELTAILFKMKVDPSISSTPFTSVDNVSFFEAEKEILFSMHSVFRIDKKKQIGERLWQIDLTLTSENDQQLKNLTDHMRKEIGDESGWHRMGRLMLEMGEFKKALEIYDTLLQAMPIDVVDDIDSKKSIVAMYTNVGEANREMGDYSTALSYYEKALEIQHTILPADHPDLGITYNNIGMVHQSTEDYSKALSYYERTLAILQESPTPNYSELAVTNNNMGEAHRGMGDYTVALSYYEKTFAIQQKYLPSNHPSLATTYNNIATVHHSMKDFSQALSYMNKTLEIQQKSLPPNHPSLIVTHSNMAAAFEHLKQYKKAVEHAECAFDTACRVYGLSHSETIENQRYLDQLQRLLGRIPQDSPDSQKIPFVQSHGTTQPSLIMDEWY
ncbi:unnamed protein product [Adineta steineri]|uniref:ADP ribosyltransferase domain-containing protein n=1 Tax=Adineta steineri TaxID=433720 RepID=A0A814DAK3_9BILA|nr:unnamed protein product [Adineta steineri]CAF3956873.1 unnamed protein product [Adineta steineri]